MVSYLLKRPPRTLLRSTHLITLIVLCLIILSFSSNLFVKADEQDPPCTVTNETKYYDLSPLKRDDGDDWNVIGYGTDWTFYINICRSVLYRDKNNQMDNFDNTGIYGINPEKKGFSLGEPSKKPFFRGDKLIMEFTEGRPCGGTNFRKSSAISFLCDKTVEGQGQPKFISSFSDCGFFFEWRTPAACSTEKSKGGWGVFFTIFVIALIVYFVGGIVYNRTVHNATGLNQIPNWEFWINTCDFIKDMILIILAQCPVFKPRRSGGNYRNLPRDEENILIGEEFEEH